MCNMQLWNTLLVNAIMVDELQMTETDELCLQF